MAQPGPSEYLSRQSASSAPEYGRGVMGQIGDQAQGLGNSAVSRASDLASAIKARPYTTLAIAAGLAFAVGALWQLKARRPHSRLESLLAQLGDMAQSRQGLHSYLPRYWR